MKTRQVNLSDSRSNIYICMSCWIFQHKKEWMSFFKKDILDFIEVWKCEKCDHTEKFNTRKTLRQNQEWRFRNYVDQRASN